jgi:uncharacterized protein
VQAPKSLAIQRTQAWVDKAVIGLNLCPFAKAPQVQGRVRYVESVAVTTAGLLADLQHELQALVAAQPEQHETTLLIHPYVLQDFEDYNEFLDVADELLLNMRLDGVVQLASFHPHYQFAGTHESEIENYTNRSPYPTLHLLREDSITKAVDANPDTHLITERNIATLEREGIALWQSFAV